MRNLERELRASLRLMLRGFLGRLGQSPEVSSFAFETLTVQVGRRRRRKRIKVATDGEIVFLRPPLTFRPSPHVLRLIVPTLEAPPDADPAANAASSEHSDAEADA